MPRPLFASWTSQAHYDAREQGLHHELEQAMELIGDIADRNFYYGPLEDKLRLLEALLKRHVKDDVVFRVMGDTRRIARCDEYADHSASIQVLAMVLAKASVTRTETVENWGPDAVVVTREYGEEN